MVKTSGNRFPETSEYLDHIPDDISFVILLPLRKTFWHKLCYVQETLFILRDKKQDLQMRVHIVKQHKNCVLL
jgi:hypothetical protein